MVDRAENKYIKVVLIGDAGTGKTHLLQKYAKGTCPRASQPTIGVEFVSKEVTLQGGETKKVQFWDTAGQERYRSITATHYKRAVGALLVYDITKDTTYDNVTKWMEELKLQAEPDIVIMLVGNKLDKVDDSSKDYSERKVSKKEAENFARENNLLFQETSAVTAQGVNSAFEHLIQQIVNGKKGLNQMGGNITLGDDSENNGKGCSC
ncbi:P-loop containing nucleoside triphosphate hydrolase [Pseudocohnilembus persalinus]|uniref:p-loop containing nucleoside triphosphate hydrolase n=1 Tax=Pseudocohnilembus persalinus TaxID=266149 RepID=A0A0V0R836_PSEPJ|nr:P-loop containing nucleoside triphosphate hydrolase [Pseudocohnilembus persalinus]|eukprot:KRX10643.1 P-loop containing nucleoside triphosphate hydrolase [Pseudocohnilembus persalinus]